MPVGRADEAIAEIRKAQELDPLSAVIATDLGKELYFVRRYDEALVELRRALELDPNFVSAHNWISDTLLEKRLYNDAIVELEKTRPFREERVYIRQTAYLYARMGRRAEARTALAKSLQLSKGKQVSSGAVALTYAALGDKDESFQWLEKAYMERSSFMTLRSSIGPFLTNCAAIHALATCFAESAFHSDQTDPTVVNMFKSPQ